MVQALILEDQLHLVNERSHRLLVFLDIGLGKVEQLEECLQILRYRASDDILTILLHTKSDTGLLACESLVEF